jgi:type IV pilus assembly protein PilA
MLQKLQNMRNKEEGFTLIELMVVVLIIAILIAIAIPTFLGARGRAQDRATQSSLRNTVTGAKSIFTDNEDYAGATQAAMALAEPALTFVATGATSEDGNTVSVNGNPAGVVAPVKSTSFVAAARSGNGRHCYYITDRVAPAANPGTWWAISADNIATCTATQAAAKVAFAATATGVAGGAGEWVKSPADARP